jgi:hypothetical protein
MLVLHGVVDDDLGGAVGEMVERGAGIELVPAGDDRGAALAGRGGGAGSGSAWPSSASVSLASTSRRLGAVLGDTAPLSANAIGASFVPFTVTLIV